MLGAHLIPARHLRHDRARRKGLRHNAALLLVAPAPPPANAISNLDAPSRARSVNYMVDHMCEPIPSSGFESSELCYPRQDAGKTPLSVNELYYTDIWEARSDVSQPLCWCQGQSDKSG
jgi:hypothetical protein